MNPWDVSNAVTRIYAAAGRRPGDVEMEVWNDAMADLNPKESQVNRATAEYVRTRDLAKDGPSPASYRDCLMAVMRRDQMRVVADQQRIGQGSGDDGPTTYGRLWLAHIRKEMAKIGQGGVPSEQRKHTAEKWEQCPECKMVAQAIAMEAAEIDGHG